MNIDEKAIFVKNNYLDISEFIEEYKPFIAACASGVVKRFLIFGEDDELSIALSAFYEAVTDYKKNKGSFLSFAKAVIQRRLIDYLRRQKRTKLETFSIDETPEEWQGIDSEISMWQYKIERHEESLRDEINVLESMLEVYGISFSELIENSPRHAKLVEDMKRAASALVCDRLLFEKFKENMRLPIKELSEMTKIPQKKIERFRKYIIVVSVILDGDFEYLKDYVREKP